MTATIAEYRDGRDRPTAVTIPGAGHPRLERVDQERLAPFEVADQPDEQPGSDRDGERADGGQCPRESRDVPPDRQDQGEGPEADKGDAADAEPEGELPGAPRGLEERMVIRERDERAAHPARPA